MSGLFKKKKLQSVKEEQQGRKSPQLQQGGDGSDSPRPFLLTSDCHGARNPLDWATIPTSLQDKFPHWKESSVPSPLLPQRKSPEGAQQRVHVESVNKKMANGSTVPDHCIPYFVMNNDSLVSIALKFDTTTAAIAKVNKMPLLGSQPIYPGDLLYIPDSEAFITSSPSLERSRDKKSKDDEQTDTTTTTTNNDVNAASTDDLKEEYLTKGRSSSLVEMQDEVTDDYVYVSSKFMSDKLCVHGYLVINRQSIMFKPNDEDPLVEDHGADPYEIWLPLQEIVYAYITKEYLSPSHNSSLQSPTPLSTATPNKKNPAPSDGDGEAHLYDDNLIDSDNGSEMANEGLQETHDKNEPVDHAQNENEPQSKNESQNKNESQKENEPPNNVDAGTTENGNQDIENGTQPNDSHEVIPQVLATEGSPSAGDSPPMVGGVDRVEPECPSNNEQITETCTENEPERNTLNHETESRTESEPHNHVENQPDTTTPIYERRDTLSSLFQDSFERSCSSSGEDIPMAPSPWFFLYCRLSQSSQQTNSVSVVGMKIPVAGQHGRRAPPTVQTVRTWFVFAIPMKRVDDIYSFLRKHHPKIDDEESSIAEIELINNRLEIINLKGSFSDDSLMISESHFLDPISSWEIFSVKDIQPPRIERMNVEEKLPLPLLIEPSKLLSNTHIRKLMPHLVSGAVGHDWYPIYSTFSHGISLQTLYRKMTSYFDNPVLLVVQDSYGKVFGAMVPCPLRISDRFYGTGESFLFTFDGEDVLVFPWIGENDYIIKGSPDSIAFGSGDGFFGLWLDENLYHGSSLSCVTYNNKPLATTPDYLIHGVEAWGFV